MYTKTITFQGQAATLTWIVGEDSDDDTMFQVTETIVSEAGDVLFSRVFMSSLDNLTSFPKVYTPDEDR